MCYYLIKLYLSGIRRFDMEYVHHCASPLGGITIAGTENAVTGLWFDGQKYFGSTLSQNCGSYTPLFLDIQYRRGVWIFYSAG